MRNGEKVIDVSSVRLADRINEYWKRDVASANRLTNTLHTSLWYGVPRAAFTTPYTHPCIVRVRRFGRVWNIVET